MQSQAKRARAAAVQMFRHQRERVATMFQAGSLPWGELVNAGDHQRSAGGDRDGGRKRRRAHGRSRERGAERVGGDAKAEPDGEVSGSKDGGIARAARVLAESGGAPIDDEQRQRR